MPKQQSDEKVQYAIPRTGIAFLCCFVTHSRTSNNAYQLHADGEFTTTCDDTWSEMGPMYFWWFASLYQCTPHLARLPSTSVEATDRFYNHYGDHIQSYNSLTWSPSSEDTVKVPNKLNQNDIFLLDSENEWIHLYNGPSTSTNCSQNGPTKVNVQSTTRDRTLNLDGFHSLKYRWE